MATVRAASSALRSCRVLCFLCVHAQIYIRQIYESHYNATKVRLSFDFRQNTDEGMKMENVLWDVGRGEVIVGDGWGCEGKGTFRAWVLLVDKNSEDGATHVVRMRYC